MAEFILIFLLFFVLSLLLVELGRAFWVYRRLTHAARQAARYAGLHSAASRNPASEDRITEVVKKYTVGLDEVKLVVRASWDPDNEPYSNVQIQARYNLDLLTMRRLPHGTIPLSSTCRTVITR
jgi:Flp pilus assembly protein TadG